MVTKPDLLTEKEIMQSYYILFYICINIVSLTVTISVTATKSCWLSFEISALNLILIKSNTVYGTNPKI